MVEEIGSEFELPNLNLLTSEDGVALPTDAVLVGAGRHALSLVAVDLLSKGVDTVVVPDHYCESMIRPFLDAGMAIQFCGTTEEFILSGISLAELLAARSEHVAILHCETFGTPAGAELRSTLDAASRAGIPVILDRTHSLLSPAPAVADYEIASLRKLLPVPDGGYVTGLRSVPKLQGTPEHHTFCELRLKAAGRKTEYLRHSMEHKLHLDEFARAEQLLDQYPRASKISDRSRVTLASLDFHSIRRTRIENAGILELALHHGSVQVANAVGWRNSPAYVVITHPDAKALRNHLTSKQIYCPIHWPRPASHPRPRSWRADLLSLPIDHRYTGDDMQRMASAILEYKEMTAK